MRKGDDTQKRPRWWAVPLSVMALACLGALAYPMGRALWFYGYLVTISLSGALSGAAAGAMLGRRGAGRSLRLPRGELTLRGARYGALAGWGSIGVITLLTNEVPWFALTFAVAAGTVTALAGAAQSGKVLSAAERAFATALACVKDGDRIGATSALRQYVEHAKDDPAREARLPAAERWLRGETETLVVVTELQAAQAPEGAGTELSASAAPEGSGTEMLAGAEPPPATPERGGAPVREPRQA